MTQNARILHTQTNAIRIQTPPSSWHARINFCLSSIIISVSPLARSYINNDLMTRRLQRVLSDPIASRLTDPHIMRDMRPSEQLPQIKKIKRADWQRVAASSL